MSDKAEQNKTIWLQGRNGNFSRKVERVDSSRILPAHTTCLGSSYIRCFPNSFCILATIKEDVAEWLSPCLISCRSGVFHDWRAATHLCFV